MPFIRTLQYRIFLCLPFLVLAGCSGSGATISGKVTANGKEVTEGTIIISPVSSPGDTSPGKPALTPVQSDGSYALELVPGSRGLATRFAVRFTPRPIEGTRAKPVFT